MCAIRIATRLKKVVENYKEEQIKIEEIQLEDFIKGIDEIPNKKTKKK